MGTQPYISGCTITKNEADTLPEMLAYYDGLVDEFCVNDTGSTDGTRDVQHPKLKMNRSNILCRKAQRSGELLPRR